MSTLFRVPGTPVAKQRAGRNIRATPGRHWAYTPPKTRRFEQAVKLYAQQAGLTPRDDEPVIVDIVAVWPFPSAWGKRRKAEATELYRRGEVSPKITKPDGDNVAKAVCDALEGVAYVRDGQVWRVTCETIYGPAAGTLVCVRYSCSERSWLLVDWHQEVEGVEA